MWVKVKGGAQPIMLSTDGLLNVFMLLKNVKEECKPDLENVAVHHLQLYQSEQAKNEGKEAPQFL